MPLSRLPLREPARDAQLLAAVDAGQQLLEQRADLIGRDLEVVLQVGLQQRRLGVPDASVLVLQGFAFMLILASEALRGRLFVPKAAPPAPVVVTPPPGSMPEAPVAAVPAPIASTRTASTPLPPGLSPKEAT